MGCGHSILLFDCVGRCWTDFTVMEVITGICRRFLISPLPVSVSMTVGRLSCVGTTFRSLSYFFSP